MARASVRPSSWPVFCSPSLDEAHPNRAHPGQLVHGFEALIHWLRQQSRELLVVKNLQVTSCGKRTWQDVTQEQGTSWTRLRNPFPSEDGKKLGAAFPYPQVMGYYTPVVQTQRFRKKEWRLPHFDRSYAETEIKHVTGRRTANVGAHAAGCDLRDLVGASSGTFYLIWKLLLPPLLSCPSFCDLKDQLWP